MLRIIFFIVVFIFTSVARAQETNPSYIIELEQIEATTEAKTQTVSDEVQKNLQENGYILAPQQKETAFIFSISDTNVDYSDIISAREKTNSTLLRINSADTYNYQIIGLLKKPFRSSLDEIISQTGCDEATPCSASVPNKWTDKESYGWGFQLSGPHVVSPFKDGTYFQIFDDEKQTIFAQHEGIKGESSTKLTFKVRVPAEQKEGNYTGVIKIIAIPKL